MDALMTFFAEQMRRRREGFDGQPPEYAGHDGQSELNCCLQRFRSQYSFRPFSRASPTEPNPIQNNGVGVLSNKLSRLTLATFDDEGRCIGQNGTLSISF